MWAKIRQPDGSYFSNYGQYIFGEHIGGISQFEFVVRTLADDVHSRRASIVLLKHNHLFADNRDIVCTYAINFAIEGTALHMTVMMRSNDAVYGFTNDSFCFWNLHRFVHACLLAHYRNLRLGQYVHIANSMHVYARHYAMVEQILTDGLDGFEEVRVPDVTADEVAQLITSHGKRGEGPYCDWLFA
jgi:thymidylate synthase